MGRFLRVLLLLGFIGGFFALVGLGFVLILSGGDVVDFIQTGLARLRIANRQDDLARPYGTDDTPIRFIVNLGDTPQLIANQLSAAQLITDPDLFIDYVRVQGLDIRLEAGTYFLNQTQTIPEIALALTDSSSSFIPFRIAEGWRLEEVAEAIDKNRLFNFSGADFLTAVGANASLDERFVAWVGLPPNVTLEGFLFPDTYQLPPDVTPESLRDTLLQTFMDRTGEALRGDANNQGWTLYQVVTLASIVERESVWTDEDALIASVYRNRLDIGMPLEADPTVQYGLNGARGVWWPQITQVDYRSVVSPYNTYLNNSLPPGPIANPGLSAIRAVVYPAESNYYFFRARCDGSNYHNFATTYDEHLANSC